MPKSTLSADTLRAALIGYEAQKAKIDAKIAELRAALETVQKPARKLSEAGKRRIVHVTTKRRTVRRAAAAVRRVRAANKKTRGTSGTGPRIEEEAT